MDDPRDLDPVLARAYRASREVVGSVDVDAERILAAAMARATAIAPTAPPRWRRWASLAAVAAVAGALGYVAGRWDAPPPASAPEVRAAAAADAAPPPDAAPAPAPDAAPVPDAAPPPPKAPPRRASGEMNEPLLIDQARAALRRKLVDEALRALERHEREFPDGQLVEEREVLFIEAEILKGQLPAARARIERYRARFPDGLLRDYVDSLRPGE